MVEHFRNLMVMELVILVFCLSLLIKYKFLGTL